MTKWREFLNGVFGNEAVKKALIWLLVVIVGTAVVLTQFLFPVHVSFDSVRLYSYSGEQFTWNIKATYDKIKDGTSKNGALLSDNDFDFSAEADFLRIELFFNFTNIGMYKIDDIQFTVDSIGKNKECFVLKEGNMSGINRFAGGIVPMYLVICTKGMTNEQINEAINLLEISYTFNRPELFPSGGKITLPEINLPFESIINQN